MLEQEYRVSPLGGIRYDELKPKHMVVVDMDSKMMDGEFKPSLDVYSHL